MLGKRWPYKLKVRTFVSPPRCNAVVMRPSSPFFAKSYWPFCLSVQRVAEMATEGFLKYIHKFSHLQSLFRGGQFMIFHSNQIINHLNWQKKNICNVRTFWETHKIWKNLPHGFEKSPDLLSKRQNHEEDFFRLCVLLKKSKLY